MNETNMRRKDFEVKEEEAIREFLESRTYGFLALKSDGTYPALIPLNYVYFQGAVYFHGSTKGEKMKLMEKNSEVSFALAKEFGIIPSYFTNEEWACPASSYFKSVLIRGRAVFVEDAEEKARVLNAFMAKLQPEGGYRSIAPEIPEYERVLRGTSLVKIIPEQISAKFKFGQNLKEKERKGVQTGLRERGAPADGDILECMERFSSGNL